jgi:hypothetical protein
MIRADGATVNLVASAAEGSPGDRDHRTLKVTVRDDTVGWDITIGVIAFGVLVVWLLWASRAR